MKKKILLIDDDMDMCLLLNRFLTREGYEITEKHSGRAALQYLDTFLPDLVICDLQLGDVEGTHILRAVKEKENEIPFIMITGYSEILSSINAVKMGAFDYVAKPLLMSEMLVTIRKALENRSVLEKQQSGKTLSIRNSPFLEGNSETFRHITRQIDLVAPTEHSVIIYGESGSGKKTVAQELHKRSKRNRKSFVSLNCNTLSGETGMLELIGDPAAHKKGAFEIANGGTLFLEDISTLNTDMQVALLSIRHSGKFAGSGKKTDLDVRILASDSENVWNAVRRGKFSDELYYTLNDFTINLHPLRERKDDIMPFALHFLKLAMREAKIEIKGFLPSVEEVLQNYSWPGNLHELQNVITKAVLLTEKKQIGLETLPLPVRLNERVP